ncbi:MAG: EamA family transporter [Pseudorhodobacter sp.]|nr:EamA family transporter [Pseudorhodobacter sp.]
MTPFVLLAVLGSAFLHALWNSLVKTGASRMGAMVILSVCEVPIGLGVALFRDAPALHVLSWVLASGLVHFFYKFFLTFAYERGDLSRVYPIARGTAPLVVALLSGVLLADIVTPTEFAGITILGLGILMMAQGVFAQGENRRLIPFALGSAAATAAYTLIDGQGARIAGDAVGYVAWVFIVDGLGFALGMLAWKGRAVLPTTRKPWATGALAGAASYGAYGISVWAMTVAPIALIAALRETSILFAVLIGWLGFGERMTRGKGLAALVIVAGVVVTRL